MEGAVDCVYSQCLVLTTKSLVISFVLTREIGEKGLHYLILSTLSQLPIESKIEL